MLKRILLFLNNILLIQVIQKNIENHDGRSGSSKLGRIIPLNDMSAKNLFHGHGLKKYQKLFKNEELIFRAFLSLSLYTLSLRL